MAFLRDITERKQAEAGLRLDGEIMANMADGVFLIRASDGMIVHTNEQFEKMFGYGLGELIGQKVAVVNAFSDHHPEAIVAEITEALHRIGAWAGEVHNLKKDGTAFWCSARVTTFEHDRYGTVWVAVHRDITERKELKAQYLRAQRLESIGTLASGIAHDLNNILSPILMGLTVIKTELKTEENRALIEMVEQSARRGADTVKQLLTFARGTVAHKGLVQPRHLLKEMGQLLRRTFPNNIQIYTNYPDRPWAILADPSQIHQVLMNLSVNARDAMPAGGVLFLKLRNQVLSEADRTRHPRPPRALCRV